MRKVLILTAALVVGAWSGAVQATTLKNAVYCKTIWDAEMLVNAYKVSDLAAANKLIEQGKCQHLLTKDGTATRKVYILEKINNGKLVKFRFEGETDTYWADEANFWEDR